MSTSRKRKKDAPKAGLSVNYKQLRRMAEMLSGGRGQFQDTEFRGYIVFDGKKITMQKEPPADPNLVVIPCDTRDTAREPHVEVAQIGPDKKKPPVNLLDLKDHTKQPGDPGYSLGAADAVFWSESAVEKFLVPYYASVYGNDATEEVRKLLAVFGGGANEGETTFGMAHIPKSEYVELRDGSAARSEVVVLTQVGGEISVLPLPDWFAQRQ